MSRRVFRIFVTFVGMIGLRFDQTRPLGVFAAWFAVFAVSVLAYGQAIVWGDTPPRVLRAWVVAYAAVAWIAYYAGLSALLGTELRQRLIDLLGAQRARYLFNAALGIVFLHQGFAHGAVMAVWPDTIRIFPKEFMTVIGGALFAIGAGVKLWSTHLATLDTYYYNDMLLGRAGNLEGLPERRGPYRWFKNPMYGVGNLQGYGSALLVASWQGLVITAVFHISIYGFYFLFERPFVARTYKAP